VSIAVSVAEVIVVIALLTFGGEVEKWVVPFVMLVTNHIVGPYLTEIGKLRPSSPAAFAFNIEGRPRKCAVALHRPPQSLRGGARDVCPDVRVEV